MSSQRYSRELDGVANSFGPCLPASIDGLQDHDGASAFLYRVLCRTQTRASQGLPAIYVHDLSKIMYVDFLYHALRFDSDKLATTRNTASSCD